MTAVRFHAFPRALTTNAWQYDSQEQCGGEVCGGLCSTWVCADGNFVPGRLVSALCPILDCAANFEFVYSFSNSSPIS